MPKPGRRINTPSEEISRFTDREGQQEVFHRLLSAVREPPVLVFYGVGGSGKTWLLRKLRDQVPAEIPSAYLDFDPAAGGSRYLLDPAVALNSIRRQLSAATPRFELALAMLHYKQGHTTEPSEWVDAAAELVGQVVPMGGTILRLLSKPLLSRLEGTPLEKLLASIAGTELTLELRRMTDQEIGNELLHYLAADLRESFAVDMQRAVRCVILLDTFEAIGAELHNDEHKRDREKWIQDLAAEFDFALVVIAGQNRLSWDEADPEWASHLNQHLVGGLSEDDAREFLRNCDIVSTSLQKSILATSKESSGGYHCFSLGLCADIVVNERKSGTVSDAETLRFNPHDWEKLARRFLKSLASNAERRWIERLALTPRFDEAAARSAFSSEQSAAQDAAWEALHVYSFVQHMTNADWSSIREEMRSPLKNQPSAQERIQQDHEWWNKYWSCRSETGVDNAAGLAWYHHYSSEPVEAMNVWKGLTKSARNAAPSRMIVHFNLLEWLEPLGLLDKLPVSVTDGQELFAFARELNIASLGRNSNLTKAIACYETAMHVYTEQALPQNWATTQNNLGVAWSDLPSGDRTLNCEKAIACYEAAMRVYTYREYPREWATIQNNIGNIFHRKPHCDLSNDIDKSIICYEAALSIRTEQEFPLDWARTQNNLGIAWSDMPSGDRSANLEKAVACFEAALRILTEQDFPHEWATINNNVGSAWIEMPSGDRPTNLRKAIACLDAALRAHNEQEFPYGWAAIQSNLGSAWSGLVVGDLQANHTNAMMCFEAALRVYTEQEFPREWAMTQNEIGRSWNNLSTGDRSFNLANALACYDAALRVYTEGAFPWKHKTVAESLVSARSELSANQPLHSTASREDNA